MGSSKTAGTSTSTNYYSPQIMAMLWEVIRVGGVAHIQFDNKTYEVTVKELRPTKSIADSKEDK